MHGSVPIEATAKPGYSAEFWQWYEQEAAPRLQSWNPGEAFEDGGAYRTRASTFRKMFEYLDQFDRGVSIIETGCAHDHSLASWGGNGCSTLLFDMYVCTHPTSQLYSVDTSWRAVDLCRQTVRSNARIECADSVAFIQKVAASGTKFDLVYLDASDLVWHTPLLTQKHHLEELLAIRPALHEETLVAVDDSPMSIDDWGHCEVVGKGGLVHKYALEVGARQVFSEYQTGWVRMVRSSQRPEKIDLKPWLIEAEEHANGGRVWDAHSIYRTIYKLTSDPPANRAEGIARGTACFFFAKMALAFGNCMGSALDWYQKAIQCDPESVEYRLWASNKIFKPLRHWYGARNEALLVTRVDPTNADAWTLLGEYNHELGDVEGCKAAYRRAIELKPDDPGPKLFMMSILTEEPDYDGVEKLAEEVLKTDKRGDALEALAFIHYRKGEHERAIELYEEGLAAGVTQEPTLRWNMSLALHSIGRYREGWVQHAWRDREKTQMALYVPFNRFKLPRWTGEPAEMTDGRTMRLHIHGEAGAGDNLCIARYLKMLVERGYDVRYETYADMASLIKRSFPDVKVMPLAPDYPGALGVEMFDYHTPIGELPHIFRTEVDTVPWFGPYLVPDPGMVNRYAAKMFWDKPGDKKSVGLCWSAGVREGLWITRYGERKSMNFDDLKKLLFTQMPWSPDFFSLQVGTHRDQMRGSLYGSLVADVMPSAPTWDDTAALVANLDLVITVDTAVAHLAGAMGKPTWLMNTAEPGSWHWMAERPGAPWNERSPWYPSVRIYRQKQVGVWDDVVGNVARDLAAFCQQA